MTKYWYRRFLVILLTAVIFIGGGYCYMDYQQKADDQAVSTTADETLLIPGGMPVGIYIETDGVMILGTEAITAVDGLNYEPAGHLVKAGDYIVGVNDETVENKRELLGVVSKLTSERVVIHLRRNGEYIDVKIDPVQCGEDEYKLGIWVRDNAQGLGTVTFLTSNSEYGALGHGIHDTDTNELIEMSEGMLYRTTIRDIKKGESGNPGGMEGVIVYNNYNILGTITKNTDAGILGKVDKINELFTDQTAIPAGKKEEIEEGPAVIRCSVDGSVKEYEIQIIKVDLRSKDVNKGIEIAVTDEELLELTGGIIQGMSGSPMIQNGKLIGAVTHVFVQDATKGYGIFIENMLEQIE